MIPRDYLDKVEKRNTVIYLILSDFLCFIRKYINSDEGEALTENPVHQEATDNDLDRW